MEQGGSPHSYYRGSSRSVDQQEASAEDLPHARVHRAGEDQERENPREGQGPQGFEAIRALADGPDVCALRHRWLGVHVQRLPTPSFSREWAGKRFDLSAVKENAIISVE